MFALDPLLVQHAVNFTKLPAAFHLAKRVSSDLCRDSLDLVLAEHLLIPFLCADDERARGALDGSSKKSFRNHTNWAASSYNLHEIDTQRLSTRHGCISKCEMHFGISISRELYRVPE